MATYNYRAGLGNVGSYQVAGTPFATGSVDCSSAAKIEFPAVTQWVIVVNNQTGQNAKVGFSENGVSGSNYFTVANGGANAPGLSVAGNPLPLKVTELWIWGPNDVDVIAGLTSVATEYINNDTVSDHYGCVGAWSSGLHRRVDVFL